MDVLEGEESLYVACGACEVVLAGMGPDWKAETARSERPVSGVGACRDCPEDLRLREWCCPACGRLLDTELAFEDDTPLSQVVQRGGDGAGRTGQ